MKTTINLPKAVVIDALDTKLKVLKRKKDNESNLLIVELLEKDISDLQNGINTAAEGK